LPEQVRSGKHRPGVAIAIEAWNVMGGVDWAALPIVLDLLGVSDPELLIRQLLHIRDKMNEANESDG